MNFRKIYECGLKYEKGNKGPFDELDTPIKKPKVQKPAVKGTPHFKYDKAGYGSIPPTGLGRKDYNVKYSKNGGLLESELKELKKLGILQEDEDNEFEDDYDDELYLGEDEEETEWKERFDYEGLDYDELFNDEDYSEMNPESTDEEFDSDELEYDDEEYNDFMSDFSTDEDDFLTNDEKNSQLGRMDLGEI